MFSIEKSSSLKRNFNSNSNSLTHINSFSQFTNSNTPQKTEDFLQKINKNKSKQGDRSICLY